MLLNFRTLLRGRTPFAKIYLCRRGANAEFRPQVLAVIIFEQCRKTESAIKKHSRLAAIIILITRLFFERKVPAVPETPPGPVKYVFWPSKQNREGQVAEWQRNSQEEVEIPMAISIISRLLFFHLFLFFFFYAFESEIFPRVDFQLVNYSRAPKPIIIYYYYYFFVIIIYAQGA